MANFLISCAMFINPEHLRAALEQGPTGDREIFVRVLIDLMAKQLNQSKIDQSVISQHALLPLTLVPRL